MLYLTSRARNYSAETKRALRAADGFLTLGMANDAFKEFAAVSPLDKNDAGVMLARNRVALHLHRWHEAERNARIGHELYPNEEEFTVQRAFALQQMQRLDQAHKLLDSAPEWLRKTGVLHYNLACYEARLGDLKNAHQCMNTAISLNAAIKRSAKKDPDLQRLWN